MNRKEEAAGLYRDFLLEQKKEKERNEEITTSEFATMLNLQQLNAEKVRLEKISQKKQLQNTRTILFSVLGLLCIVVIFCGNRENSMQSCIGQKISWMSRIVH